MTNNKGPRGAHGWAMRAKRCYFLPKLRKSAQHSSIMRHLPDICRTTEICIK